MESRVIQLTSAAHKHGNLNLSACGKEFFPPDVFGGSTEKQKGHEITIIAEGLLEPVKTDIPTEKNGRIRWMFRQRSWAKKFVKTHNLNANDTVTINRIAPHRYVIKPNGMNSHFVALRQPARIERQKLEDAYRNLIEVNTYLNRKLVSFQANKDIPFYNWFSYKEGFSYQMVKMFIKDYPKRTGKLLDPFSGSGTALFAATEMGFDPLGIE